MLDLPDTDERRDLERHITEVDRALDQPAYQLYGLAEEEIAIVEGRRPKRRRPGSGKGRTGMIEVVTEFTVREDARGRFELVYGPGGAWSRLFGQSAGFRGATVLNDLKNPRRYLTIDLWDTEAQWAQALDEGKADYSVLQAELEGCIESRADLGVFRVRGEATVHPRLRARPVDRRTRR
jgi:heme-degrading monooxygenase HmoA